MQERYSARIFLIQGFIFLLFSFLMPRSSHPEPIPFDFHDFFESSAGGISHQPCWPDLPLAIVAKKTFGSGKVHSCVVLFFQYPCVL